MSRTVGRWRMMVALGAAVGLAACSSYRLAQPECTSCEATAPVHGSWSIVARCRDGHGLCRFWPPASWERVFTYSRNWDDFRALRGGALVVREYAHEAGGSLFVISADGRVVVTYDLYTGLPLDGVFGERADGSALLCNGDEYGRTWCDVSWDPLGRKPEAVPIFPSGCSWPRFLPDGSSVCWHTFDNTLELEEAPRSGRFSSYEVPIAGKVGLIENIHPLSRDCILLEVDHHLYAWTGSSLKEVETPPVGGSRQVKGRVYFTSCKEIAANPGGCDLWWIDERLSTHQIWSTPLVPVSFEVLDDGSVIVDEWLGGTRKIVKVGPESSQETVLWSQRGSVWK
jgi:hypothetical protein